MKGSQGCQWSHLSKCEVKDYSFMINLEIKLLIFEVTKLWHEETKNSEKTILGGWV